MEQIGAEAEQGQSVAQSLGSISHSGAPNAFWARAGKRCAACGMLYAVMCS